MKFDIKYPNAKHNEEPEMLVVCFKDSPPKPCWHCGEPTVFVEISFEANLCSEECVDAKWKEYEEAERRAQERDKAAAGHGGDVAYGVSEEQGRPVDGSQEVREPELPRDPEQP